MFNGIYFDDEFVDRADLENHIPRTNQQTSSIRFINDWLAGNTSFNLQTSGSTGEARTIIALREKMELSAQKTLDYFSLDSMDRAFVAMPTAYIAGKMMLVRALIAGMQITITEPSRLPRNIEGEHTFTALSPLQLSSVWNAGLDLSLYRCILVGGAPVPESLRSEIAKTDLPVFETYGMTETLSHIAVRKVGETAFTNIHDLKLITDNRGCLRIKGELTNQQWLQTNDRVRILKNGKFIWLGRADWTINSSGLKIQPEEVEHTISEICRREGWPGDFFIHGFAHPEFGEAAVLIFEGALPANSEAILATLRKAMDRYQVPKAVTYVSSFKRGRTNKLQRRETAELLVPFTF